VPKGNGLSQLNHQQACFQGVDNPQRLDPRRDKPNDNRRSGRGSPPSAPTYARYPRRGPTNWYTYIKPIRCNLRVYGCKRLCIELQHAT